MSVRDKEVKNYHGYRSRKVAHRDSRTVHDESDRDPYVRPSYVHRRVGCPRVSPEVFIVWNTNYSPPSPDAPRKVPLH